MARVTEIQAETTHDKTLRIDGRKMTGVKAVVFTYDSENVVATATLTMHIKRGSVVITENNITFDTPVNVGVTEDKDGH